MGEPCRDCRADDKVACASVCGLVAHYDRWLSPPMTGALAGSDGRTEFIAAITKLADDADFRASFLDHYNKWLSPLVVVEPPSFQGNTYVGSHFGYDVDPASRYLVDQARRWLDDETDDEYAGRVHAAVTSLKPVKMWCPDTNDAPIEGIEIAPRPVMQALN